MFIAPPNNYNGTPMWNNCPMFFEPPMMPLPDFDTFEDDIRQKPLPVPPGSNQTPSSSTQMPPTNQNFEMAPIPPVVSNVLYTQGWLATQIGEYAKIDFLLGTNILQDREGIIKEVGISYIVIKESGTNDLVMCDIYAIKFVRIFHTQPIKCMP